MKNSEQWTIVEETIEGVLLAAREEGLDVADPALVARIASALQFEALLVEVHPELDALAEDLTGLASMDEFHEGVLVEDALRTLAQ